ncbi:hypothetical protein MKEN_00252800 [Mycena kentingensis (nom. inval.)]|nr:hypothetical protein MKEN_00252800 [Mycena kentingensis (nom. inval.)]
MPPIHAPPKLSLLSAQLLALTFSSTYVGSIFLVGFIQPGVRDQPHVIRARLGAVTVASVVSCATVHYLVNPHGNFWDARTLGALGFTLPNNALSYLQTPLLFLGPLYAMYLHNELLSGPARFVAKVQSWIGFRNFVWGPITEEIVFRSCVLAALSLAGVARWKMVAFAPLLFGLAHVHHGYAEYKRCGRTKAALKRAVLMTLFQTAYTSLFGAHASFLFLRTGSILPPLSAHIFCNTMGTPELGAEVRSRPDRKLAIYAAYLMGIGLFAYTIVPWTS